MGDGHKNRVTKSLVAMSSAAILTVYAAGFVRTRAAAARFAGEAFEPASRPAPSPAPVEPVRPKPAPSVVAPTPSAREPVAAPPVAPAPVVDTPVAAPVAPIEKPVEKPAEKPADKAADTPVAPPAPAWKDGTYFGWGTSRHGDIQARVVIESGRILSATISNCQTRYSCSVIDKLPPQVPVRQSADVDFVSGATQSTYAFYYAVLEALSKAK